MIKNFKHKGLRKFYESGSTAGINAQQVSKIRVILARLESCLEPEDMDLPGLRFHALKGELKGMYSVTVSKNWRIIFSFHGKNAHNVDLVDYH